MDKLSGGALVLAVALLLIQASSAFADHLDVQRAAAIHKSASSGSDILSHPAIGTHLILLDNGTQTAGYYHVVDPTSQQPGWIYRTLVSVEQGDSPPAPVNNNPPAPPSGDTMQVHYINMKQGNAALLEFSCGAMLIDAGGQNQETTDGLIAYLHAFFARRADLNNTLAGIIITHTHIDHDLALRTVVETFPVSHYVFNGHTKGSGRPGAIWMQGHANDNGRHVIMETVTEANTVPGSKGYTDATVSPLACSGTNPQIHILTGPYSSNPGWSAPDYTNENNSSLVVRVDFGSSSFLFSGDQQTAAIATMLARASVKPLLRADVWEVGHHGSDNATTAALLTAIAPKMAVISMGDPTDETGGLWTAWRYGHPRQSTVDLLNDALSQSRAPSCVPIAVGSKNIVTMVESKAVYATGWDGTIDITADAGGVYSVALEHPKPAACGGGG